MSREGAGFGSIGGWTRLPKSKNNKTATTKKKKGEKKKKKENTSRSKKSRLIYHWNTWGSIKYLMQRRIE